MAYNKTTVRMSNADDSPDQVMLYQQLGISIGIGVMSQFDSDVWETACHDIVGTFEAVRQ
jgi:hypothetical protein